MNENNPPPVPSDSLAFQNEQDHTREAAPCDHTVPQNGRRCTACGSWLKGPDLKTARRRRGIGRQASLPDPAKEIAERAEKGYEEPTQAMLDKLREVVGELGGHADKVAAVDVNGYPLCAKCVSTDRWITVLPKTEDPTKVELVCTCGYAATLQGRIVSPEQYDATVENLTKEFRFFERPQVEEIMGLVSNNAEATLAMLRVHCLREKRQEGGANLLLQAIRDVAARQKAEAAAANPERNG